MFDEDIIDGSRVVKSFHAKPGGLFTSGEVTVEYEPIKYEFVDRAKRIVICNACQGAGQRPGPYHKWDGNDMRKCNFCDGAGTLKLKPPKKEV